jgi:hypothetical protein
MIYKGVPTVQLPAIAAIIHQKLRDNYRCLYLNNPQTVADLRSTLAACGIDADKEIKAGRLILSSEAMLKPDGTFDTDLMLQTLEDLLDAALSDGYKGLWASGDMSYEFGNEANLAKLFDYEWQLEKLFDKRPELCGVCQYHQDTLPAESMRQGLSVHKLIFVNETLSLINPNYVESREQARQAAANPALDEAVHILCEQAR